LINVNDSLTDYRQITAHAFNKYFLTVAENITVEYLNDKNSLLNNTNLLANLHNAFKQWFPNIKLTYITSKESEEIIKSLKKKNSHGYDDMLLVTKKSLKLL
jgi:hypothetical protein